jgi:surfactin synthase thioesterase subunit
MRPADSMHESDRHRAARQITSVPVLCFPPAGAGASFYHRWRGSSPWLEFVPVELPGRERRFAEMPHTDLEDLVAQLAAELDDRAGDASRLVVFGHSFGAILAYETVRALLRRDETRDLVLVVSGSTAPGRPRGRPLADLPDDELVPALRRMTGHHNPALDDPDLRELLLPVMRLDVKMHESYRPAAQQPLAVPIVALRGRQDELVSARAAAEWRTFTREGFSMAELPGGHMYLEDSWRLAIDLIERGLLAEAVAA